MEDRQLKLMPASGTLAQLYRTIDVLCLKLQEYILDLAVNWVGPKMLNNKEIAKLGRNMLGPSPLIKPVMNATDMSNLQT